MVVDYKLHNPHGKRTVPMRSILCFGQQSVNYEQTLIIPLIDCIQSDHFLVRVITTDRFYWQPRCRMRSPSICEQYTKPAQRVIDKLVPDLLMRASEARFF